MGGRLQSAGDILIPIDKDLSWMSPFKGADIYDAVRLGAYIHGLAGDLAAQRMTEYSLIATDITKYLPRAFMRILTGE